MGGLGAAFRAANISTAFRVRKVGVQDISVFGVSLKLETLPSKSEGFFGGLFGGKDDKKSEGGEEWSKQTAIYPRLSAVPSKAKTVAFNYDKDILCKIEYDEDSKLPEGTSKLLAVYNVTGVAEFAKETESKGLGQPKVHLSFTLDSSGVVSLNKAEATVELPPEEPTAEEKTAAKEEEDAAQEESVSGEGEKSTDANADKSGTDQKANTDADADTKDGENSTDSTDSNETDSKTKKKDKKKEKKEKKKKVEKKDTHLRRTLTIEDNPTLISPPAWSTDELAESRDKLAALDYEDRQRKAKEAALNELEGYVYKVKNRLMDDEAELSKVSTEEQRTSLSELASATSEWIDDEAGQDTDLTIYKEKLTDIRTPAEAMFKRYSELTDRSAAILKAREQLIGVKTTVGKWTETMPQVTEEEKSKLLDLVEKANKWLDD